MQGLSRVDFTGKKGRSRILQSGKDSLPAACFPFWVTGTLTVAGAITTPTGFFWITTLWGFGGVGRWTRGGVGPGRGMWEFRVAATEVFTETKEFLY